MEGLVIAPGPGIPGGLVIPEAELSEKFTRSSGPGGQHANTADSAVHLSFDIAASRTLSQAQRQRVLTHLRPRLRGPQRTVFSVSASTQRSQLRNRADARRRMAAELREALAPPPSPRRKSTPSRAAHQRRLANKRRTSELKRLRHRIY